MSGLDSPAQIRTILGKWALPIFITPDRKYPVGVMAGLIAMGLYMPTNHFHFFTPRLLPLSWVDTMVPFLPDSVWIYISEYTFFIAVYLTCRDLVNLNKYFYSFLALQAISVFIFCVWPTTYPREQFPLPENLNEITYYVFNHLRMTDTPASCCPSLHVSSCYLSSFIFLDDQKKKFPFFFLWATAVAISTLTTKQHYLIDVIAGLFMAIITYWVFHRFISYRPITFLRERPVGKAIR